jgi:AcrR family transcriptional regulator
LSLSVDERRASLLAAGLRLGGMATAVRRGRPPASSRESIAAAAVELFFARGYAETTIAMIASAADISETSFFRYFSSKAETVWADFDAHTERLRRRLAGNALNVVDLDVVRKAVVETLRVDLDTGGLSLRKFELFDTSPELRSEEAVHWFTWAEVVSSHLDGAEHTAGARGSAGAAAVGAAVQATMLAALRSAVRDPAPPETVLGGLDAQLKRVCAALEPLLSSESRENRPA